MPNVICIGELLIDFCATQADVGLAGVTTFVKAAVGALPCIKVGAIPSLPTARDVEDFLLDR